MENSQCGLRKQWAEFVRPGTESKPRDAKQCRPRANGELAFFELSGSVSIQIFGDNASNLTPVCFHSDVDLPALT